MVLGNNNSSNSVRLAEISALTGVPTYRISDKDEMISGLDQTISDKDKHIFKTTEDFEREIEEIKKSKVWKLLRKLDSLRNKT